MIAMPSDALLRTIIAVDEGSVDFPRVRILVLELFAVGVEVFDSPLDFTVHYIFDLRTCFEHLRGALADIGHWPSIVDILCLLFFCLGQTVDIKTKSVWRFYDSIEELKVQGCVRRCFF